MNDGVVPQGARQGTRPTQSRAVRVFGGHHVGKWLPAKHRRPHARGALPGLARRNACKMLVESSVDTLLNLHSGDRRPPEKPTNADWYGELHSVKVPTTLRQLSGARTCGLPSRARPVHPLGDANPTPHKIVSIAGGLLG